MAAGVEPQSSCSFSPIAPARICSCSPSGIELLPLPRKPKFIGSASVDCSIRSRYQRPGRARRRLRACRRPGAAADERRHAARQRDVDLLRADVMNVRVDAARRQDEAFAGNRLGRDADDEIWRDARHHVGIAGFADACDASVFDADVGLVDAGPIDDERVGDDEIERAIVADARRLSHAVAQHLAAAELALVAVDRVVALDLCDQIRVGQANAIARRGAVDVGVMPPRHAVAHSRPPRTIRLPAISTSATVLVSPGSNRTAVPAGMSRRRPVATCSIEFERAIGLRKVIVAADLDRPIAAIRHLHLHGFAPFVEENRRRQRGGFRRPT